MPDPDGPRRGRAGRHEGRAAPVGGGTGLALVGRMSSSHLFEPTPDAAARPPRERAMDRVVDDPHAHGRRALAAGLAALVDAGFGATRVPVVRGEPAVATVAAGPLVDELLPRAEVAP